MGSGGRMIFKRLFSKDAELNRVQDNVGTAVQGIVSQPQMGGVFIPNITLAIGDNIVNHGLMKSPLGFVVLSKSATGDLWKSSTVNPRPELSIIINSSAAQTATL